MPHPPLLLAVAEHLSHGLGFVDAVTAAQAALGPYSPRAGRERARLLADPPPVDAALEAVWRHSTPLDVAAQQFVSTTEHGPGPERFEPVHGAFPALASKPLGGLWTSTARWVPEVGEAVGVWRPDGPVPPVRVHEIGGAADWVALCDAFPRDTTAHYGPALDRWGLEWEAPFVTPDWEGAAGAYDAVHLQWSGVVDTFGRLLPTVAGTTRLLGWDVESTLWLRWVVPRWRRA